MFATRSPAQTYARIGIETGVASANPTQLTLMLYDGAICAVGKAQFALNNGDLHEKGRAINHALTIIQDGLQSSLDLKVGGEFAKNLNDLYIYMCNRLIFANFHNTTEPLAEVERLLSELRSAWAEIDKKPVGQQNAGNAPASRNKILSLVNA